jgi:hypothetical protein
MESQLKLKMLDTTYVSLAALIRHLRENEFRGRLHVAFDDYEADVFLYGTVAPSVWEREPSSGRESRGEEAQQRLVRAREPGGRITIFEGRPGTDETSSEKVDQTATETDAVPEAVSPASNPAQLVESSGEIIAAVERAVRSTGVDFEPFFRVARIAMGDDYPFIDPTCRSSLSFAPFRN